MKTVADAIFDHIAAAGIDTVFGIPGGAVAPLYAALLRRRDVRHVTAKHEAGAAFMAMGYAMATGRPGVLLTTAGPGVTNALTGVASAAGEGIPLVYLAGDVPTSLMGRGALQESGWGTFSAVELMTRFCKFSTVLTRPAQVSATIDEALEVAREQRGPSFVSVPLDVAGAGAQRTVIARAERPAPQVDTKACIRAAKLLSAAQRPLIIAGAGANTAGGRLALRRLAEASGVPVATTPKAKGVLPDDHPLALGGIGFGGHESTMKHLQSGVDVLLVLGSQLNDFATNSWAQMLQPSSALIQVDLDPHVFGRNYHVDLPIVGSVERVISVMLESGDLSAGNRSPSASGVSRLPVEDSPTGRITTPQVMEVLNEVAPDGAVYTVDMGEFLSSAIHFLRVKATQQTRICLGFGSMGSSIGTAIGHQLGAPEHPVYALAGDGAFFMYGGELAVAVKHRVPVRLLVFNDGRLNMCHHGMIDLFGRTVDFDSAPTDFAALARSIGARGTVIRTRDELRVALAAVATGPELLDLSIDPDVRIQGSQRNAALRQFQPEGAAHEVC